MMKTKRIILFCLLALALIVGLIWGYYLKSHAKIDCQGRAVWEINGEVFKGDVAYQLYNGEGIVTITGELSSQNVKNYKISRIVYFDYHKVRSNYFIHTTDLVRFPTDNLEDVKGHRAMPDIYLAENVTFSFRIETWQEGWAFTTIGGPSLLCRQTE